MGVPPFAAESSVYEHVRDVIDRGIALLGLHAGQLFLERRPRLRLAGATGEGQYQ